MDEKDKLDGQTWRLSQNMTEEQLKQLEEEYKRENMKIWDQWKIREWKEIKKPDFE